MTIGLLADEFLALLCDGAGSQDENESALERLLDALALAVHDVVFEFDASEHPDPPDWPYAERRAIATERFPNYGYYNAASPVSEAVGSGTVVTGDAIDDIADIAGDLRDVAWRWRNTSEADALWHFENSYRHHWGQHLRCLQLYLYCHRNGW